MNDNEIVTMYVSADDVAGTHITPGWYFETDRTDVPQGPYKSERNAKLSAQNYVPDESFS